MPNNYASANAIVSRALQSWAPPPDISALEFAEQSYHLSRETSDIHGKYDSSVTPWVREILDCATDPAVKMVVCKKAAQMAWTTVLNIIVSWNVIYDPGPMAILFPSDEMGRDWSKTKWTPAVRDSPAIGRVVKTSSGKAADNSTILMINFDGGQLQLIGSNSPSKVSAKPIRFLAIEEPSRCATNTGGEGQSIELFIERGKTFSGRKILLGGSPTLTGECQTEEFMKQTDRRQLQIPCPACDEYQTLDWEMIRMPETPDAERYSDANPGGRRKHQQFGWTMTERTTLACKHCQHEFDNTAKKRMLARCKWVATEPFNGAAGFDSLSELYSPFPFGRLQDVAEKYLKAQAALEKGDDRSMVTFVNTCLAQTYEDTRGEGVDPHDLERLRDFDGAIVPAPVCWLGMAVDIQGDRFEYEILGHGDEGETWGIAYGRIEGGPHDKACWRHLDRKIASRLTHASGETMPIQAVAIDAGHEAEMVYEYARKHAGGRVYAVRGVAGWDRVTSEKRKHKKNPLWVWYNLGVDSLKVVVHNRLKIKNPGAGYCHINKKYPPDWKLQMTCEKLKPFFSRGHSTMKWFKNPWARNEAFDIRVYGLALADIAARYVAHLRPPGTKLPPPVARPKPKPEANYITQGRDFKNWIRDGGRRLR